MTRSSLRRSVSLTAALVLAGCLGDSTSPTHSQVATLTLTPVFQTRSALSVSFNRVRITLSREVGTALDTVVAFPPTADSLLLALRVRIRGTSESLALDLRMINAAGDTVFRGGPITVTATTGVINRGPPVAIPVRYVGVGANARSVRIATRAASVFFRDSVVLTATAFDSASQPIPGTPIVWRSLDTSIVKVPADSIGKVVGSLKRGAGRVQAALLTNLADTVFVTVQPVPAAIFFGSGNGQTGTAGTVLAQPVQALVRAADSLGVRNVWVHFTVTAGGGRPSADSVLTDTTGNAAVLWTLGTVAGTQTLQASVAGLSGTVTFSATAVAGTPASLSFTTQPVATVAGAPIAPAVVVTARDSLGNTAGGFTGSVSVAITAGTGKTGAALRGTKSVTAVAGVATFTGLSIDSAGTGYTLTATGGGLPSATSSAFAISSGAAFVLAFTSQPPVSTVYQTPFGFSVTAKDSVGNIATGFAGTVTVAIGTNPAGGTLSGTLAQTATASVATFSGISIDNIGSGYTLSASANGLNPGTSAAFRIIAPAGVNAWISTAGGNWSVAGNWSKGAVPVATDTVAIRQSGTYTVTLNVSPTVARVDVGAPLGAPTLSFNGNKLGVTGNFSTLASGAISMANALDSLGVGGNATFGGGASTLSAGTISVGGNFAQSGAANAFAPGAAPGTAVVLNGGAAQSIAFTDAANSFFRRLQVNKAAGGVVLTTNVRASFFRVQSATAVTGPTARLLTDTVYSPTSTSSISPLAVEITAVLGDTGGSGFSPDTTVFTGASQAISSNNTGFQTYAFKSIRVAQSSGTATMASALSLPNNLVVSAGGLSLNRFGVAVTGNFRTEATGVLVMTSPTDSLGVGGNVTFGGGTTGSLTSGVITVGGNFVQTGAGAVFAPSGTHRVRFGRSTAGVQTIQFADSVNSFFHDLVLNRPIVDTVRLLSNVQVQDSATVTGSSVLASTALEALKLPATGVLREPNTVAVVKPSRVEFGILAVDSAFTGTSGRIRPDTAVFLSGGNITSASPAYGWRSVRLAGGALGSGGTTYNGNLILSAGTYTPSIAGPIDSVGGFLRTEGTGVLSMPVGTVPPTVAVRDSAVFAGGSEGGLLLSGTLRINGNFVQRGPTTTSFQASGAHTTLFEGSARQTITFANPGANFSTFANLTLNRLSGAVSQPTSVALGSAVFVAGLLQDTSAAAADSIFGGGNTLTTGGFNLNDTYISNAPVVVTNTTQLLTGTVVTFAAMSPTAIQLTMSRLTGPITLTSFAFLVAPTGAGKYFSATSTATAGPVTYTFSTPVQPPAASPPAATQYSRLGAPPAVVVWGTTPLP